MSRRTTSSAGEIPLLASELALLLVHLAVVFGYVRLYDSRSFVVDLAAVVIAGHLLAGVTRRLNLPGPVVVAVAVTVGASLITVLLFRSTARWGFIPSGATWDAASNALAEARNRFDEITAPSPVLPGFQLVSAFALWCAVWFADWAAFRLRATVEAVAPATVLFVFGALLGSGDQRITTAAVFAATVLGFIAAHRALRAQVDLLWLGADPDRGPRAALRAGAGLAVAALALGVIVGPRLPGSAADGVVDWRGPNPGAGDRTTVSPIVDIRKRLVDQSDDILFTVRTDQRAYLRLTSLDRFDGQLWTSDGQFGRAGDQLPSSGPQLERTRRIEADINILALDAIWAPVAYEARSIPRATGPLRWDDESSTLIVDRSEENSDGLAYQVVSEAPDLTAAQLAELDTPDAEAIRQRYLPLPVAFPDEARSSALIATGGATTRYEAAIALQNWFRENFTYSLEVGEGHSDDALVDFLASREGYCEQFAGTYAAMARSLGIPARVAVGFTPGDPDPNDPDRYLVRGRHAHAWPEVWFPDVGWVAFEPTPGRGMPGAEAYTGVAEAQDETLPAPGPVDASTTTTTAPGATSAPATTAPADPAPTAAATASGSQTGGGMSAPSWVATLLLVGALLWLGVAFGVPRLRRAARRGTDDRAVVLGAWADAGTPVRWLTGRRAAPAETPEEFARRAAPGLGDAAIHLQDLAGLATTAAWNPAAPEPIAATRARLAVSELEAEARRRSTPWQRIRRRLSWREAFDLPYSSVGSASPSLRRLRRRSEVIPR